MHIKEAKTHLRAFMRRHYTDERLAMLLAHAQEGKLHYYSCCCFVGIPTADHALQDTLYASHHYLGAVMGLPGAVIAQYAFYVLAVDDVGRRRILIPIIKAEMRRRARMRRAADLLFASLCGGSPVETSQKAEAADAAADAAAAVAAW